MPLERVLVATDARMLDGADGAIWSTHPAVTGESFAPLSEVFGSATLFARRAAVDAVPIADVGGPRWQLALVPDFTSALTLFAALPRILIGAWTAVAHHDVVLGRLPEPLSLLLGWTAVLKRKPFIANLVADPTAPRLGGILRGPLNRALLTATRGLVRRSRAAIYVTESYLQTVCPPPEGPTLVRSNVLIDRDWFSTARGMRPLSHAARVVLVGSSHTWGKGHLVLLDAAQLLAREGRTVDLTFVGSGELDTLRAEARKRDLPGQVQVLGQINSREQLAAVLDGHDLFCLPSFSEGLPRAMIEALARGLPAVGTRVGGIPELLPEDALCAPGDVVGLADALRNVIDDPRPHVRSAAGIETARRVAEQAQPSNLIKFLREVRED